MLDLEFGPAEAFLVEFSEQFDLGIGVDRQVGREALGRDFDAYFAALVGEIIVFSIGVANQPALQDDVLIVMVMAVDKCEDSVVYQSAMQRVSEKMQSWPRQCRNA